jgi:hypothetical protein
MVRGVDFRREDQLARDDPLKTLAWLKDRQNPLGVVHVGADADGVSLMRDLHGLQHGVRRTGMTLAQIPVRDTCGAEERGHSVSASGAIEEDQ